MSDKVFFKDLEGNRLCGIVSDPVGNKENPIMVLCHGFSTSKDNYTNQRLQEVLNKAGIPIFRFDLYAHGESEGSLDKLTLQKWVLSILAACSYVRSLGYSKIGLFGSSFSGPAAVMAASSRNDILFLVLKSPGMGQTSRKRSLVKESFERGVWFIAAKKISVPSFIVHGDSDKDVEIEQSERLLKSLENAELKIIPGADHTYSKPEYFEKMLKLVSNFIIKNFNDKKF